MKRTNLLRLPIDVLTSTYIAIALVAGVLFVFMVPPFFGLDEAAHFNRVYQIGHAQLFADHSGNEPGGYVPKSLRGIEDRAASIRKLKGSSERSQLWERARQTPLAGPRGFAPFPGSAVYTPIAYLSALPGYAVARVLHFSVGGTLIAARLTSLVAFVAIAAYAIWLLRSSKLKWLVAAASLLPVVVFQSAVITADSMVIALSLLTFSIFAKALTGREICRVEVILLATAGILLPLAKLNYLFVSMLVLVIPGRAFKIGVPAKYVTWLKFGVVGIAFLACLAWLAVLEVHGGVTVNGGSNPQGQLRSLILHPWNFIGVLYQTLFHNGAFYTVDYINTMIGRLGYNFVNVPVISIVSAWTVLTLAALYAGKELRSHKMANLIGGGLGLLAILSIFATLYLSNTPVNHSEVVGMQGRYILPVLPLLLSAISLYVPITVTAEGRPFAKIVVGISCLNLVLALWYYYTLTYVGIRG
jgi:uncharacterized membrane protein